MGASMDNTRLSRAVEITYTGGSNSFNAAMKLKTHVYLIAVSLIITPANRFLEAIRELLWFTY